MKHTPVPEIIKNEIEAAINIPSLQHIVCSVVYDEGLAYGEEVTVSSSGRIHFYAAGKLTGVSLQIKADMSMVLCAPDEPRAISWTANEATPERVKEAVIDALRAVVRAAA